jgi:AsmA protein
LLGLLAHRTTIVDLTLMAPHITVTRDARGMTNWSPIIDNLARTLRPGRNSISFSEIAIKDGTLAYRDDANGVTETINDIDLALAWPSISRSFAATGQIDWRGSRIDGSLSITDFIAALSGDRSGIKLRLASAPLKLAFDGAATSRGGLQMEGTLTADSDSLRNALRWVGLAPVTNAGFGRFAMKARAALTGSTLALTNVNIELDGNTAEGVIALANSEMPTLQATLASDALDLTPYVSGLRALTPGTREWSRLPFDNQRIANAAVDMRLSAAKVTVGSLKLGRTAVGAAVRGGLMSISIGEAQVFGGLLKGTFSLARSATAVATQSQFQFVDIDLGAAMTEWLGTRRINGRGSVAVAVQATGNSLYELSQSADGSATLTAQDGYLQGFNVEQLLRRLERRPLSGATELRAGRTPFDTLNASVKLDNGVAAIEEATVSSSGLQISLSGTASVPNRDYDMKGTASLVAAAGSPPGFALPFVVQGPWDDPLVFPDPDSLIRRSPASAPLLDAVRDRKTRDAVRSVIERVTGKPAAPPPAATEQQN